MTEAEEIVSPDDPRLRPYRDLKDSALRRSAELAGGYFVLEGRFALETALASPYPLQSVLVLRRRLPALRELRLPPGAPVYVAEEEVMAGVAGFEVHRGILGLARRLPPRDPASLLVRGHLVVVVEAVTDQENLGSIFRNAAAFGAGAVLLDPTCADPLYRRSVRVSLGQVLRVPFARLEPWPGSLQLLAKNGFVTVALTPARAAEAVEDAAEALQGQKVALVVGAEGAGLSPAVVSSGRKVRVPIAPGVDSLNVAVALAVALHRFGGPKL